MSDFRDGCLGSTSVVLSSSFPIVSWEQLMVFHWVIGVRKFDVNSSCELLECLLNRMVVRFEATDVEL